MERSIDCARRNQGVPRPGRSGARYGGIRQTNATPPAFAEFLLEYVRKVSRDFGMEPGVLWPTGLRLSLRWRKMIHAGSATQRQVDTLMAEPLAGFEKGWFGATCWCAFTYEFSCWAESKGFDVPAKEEIRRLVEHWWTSVLEKERRRGRSLTRGKHPKKSR